MNNNITLENNKPYQIGNLAKKCNELSYQILIESLNYLDQLIMDNSKRKKDYIVKGFYSRTITTIYGTITFKRRLYQNKIDKTYVFLLDKLIGIDAYSRLTDDAILAISEAAIECKSYKVAGLYALSNTIVSRQTVYKCLDKINYIQIKKANKIKADCIHIAIDGFFANYNEFQRKIETKFANIYTGIESITPKRNKLIGKTVLNQTTQKNFKQVLLKTLNTHYDINENTKILICGDGASWIKSLVEDIPNSEFVIDKFHYKRALKLLPNYSEAINAFHNNDIDSLASQLSNCKTDYQIENLKYVISNFEYTKKWDDLDFICCSTENIVSHVYNHRIRGIPRNWGKNLFKISSALAFKATNSLKIELKKLSDDKLLDKFHSISDLFSSFDLDSYKDQFPILKYKNCGLRDIIKSLIY